jgi:hypothetical protein
MTPLLGAVEGTTIWLAGCAAVFVVLRVMERGR